MDKVQAVLAAQEVHQTFEVLVLGTVHGVDNPLFCWAGDQNNQGQMAGHLGVQVGHQVLLHVGELQDKVLEGRHSQDEDRDSLDSLVVVAHQGLP